MPINTPSREYSTFAPKWKRLRDVADGEDAVKAKDKTYLAQPGGMLNDDYKSYLARAQFYNATGRTILGLTGALTRKPPQVELPEDMRPKLDSITLAGDSLEELSREGDAELLTIGRWGLLVDMAADGSGLPYIQAYRAESILDVRTEVRQGRKVLTQVRLLECYDEPDAKDPWVSNEKQQVRLLELNEKGEYQVSVYREKKVQDKTEWVRENEPNTPKVRGVAWTEIPFVTLGAVSPGPEIQKPPLDDLATANLAHYRCDADIKWGLFYVAMPTPVVKGYAGKEAIIPIGPSVVLPLREQGDFFFGEIEGSGLEIYRAERGDIEKQMVHLGAMLLRDQKREAETAESMRLAQSADSASLYTIVGSLEYGLEVCLRWWAQWQGSDPEAIHLKLNRDFFDTSLQYNLADLTNAWRAGTLTDEALVYLLGRAELLPPGKTPEEYLLELRANKPAPQPAPTFPPNPTNPTPDYDNGTRKPIPEPERERTRKAA